jgi:Xaa-Pro aminopeptidase
MSTVAGPLALLDRLRAGLEEVGLRQAVLSHVKTLAQLDVFEFPVEDNPVASPFVAVPALLLVGPRDIVLVVADFHQGDVAASATSVVPYRSFDWQRDPDPAGELRGALISALDEAGFEQAPTGVEAASLPFAVAEWLREAGRMPVACDAVVAEARRIRLPFELDAVRRAARLADIVQDEVKARAQAGLSEAELAGLALAAAYREAGRRVPVVLGLTTGEATSTGGGTPTGRIVQQGDIVLTDAAPWVAGAWADSANAVVVGTPDAKTRRRYDAVRRALEEGIALCRPGIVAKELDRRIRELLAEHGPTYHHHSGHAVGVDYSLPPRITPYEELPIEEGMVIALEPAIYEPGWGGIRLEHIFLVGAGGNELLTQFEHAL